MNVYLCGPINQMTDDECMGWRRHASERLSQHRILNPMDRDYRGMESLYKDIVAFDLQDIDESDCLLVNAGRASWGTAMEVFYAARAGKSVVAYSSAATDSISPWLRCHCTAIYWSLEEACNAINNLQVLTALR